MSGEPELLVRGGHVLTMAADGQGPRRADVLVRGDRIAWLGTRAPRASGPRQVLDARGALVTPGLVQSHVHLCQVLFRGLADELPLMRWLRERIWPLEAAHDARSLRQSARLGVAELLLGGTTCILDMGTLRFQDEVFAAMVEFGIRGRSGQCLIDRGAGGPRGFRTSTAQALRDAEATAERWEGAAEGRLGYAYAPRFILSCSERLLRGVAEQARAQAVPIHTHVAEHAEERVEVRKVLGEHDLAAFARFGIRGPDVVMAHGVQLGRGELRSASRQGTRLVHCPSTNLKLASGIADVVAMHDAGLVVGIGADGAPCNNRLDGLGEVRHALLLAKVRRLDAAALSPLAALRMATLDGARCLGWERDIGSLEVGKKADLAVFDQQQLHQAPALDALSSLVYASSARDCRHVVVDGAVRVRDGELLGVDVARLRATAQRQAKKVIHRAGL